MIHYRFTSAIIALCIALIIIYLIRRDRMQPSYATWWFGTALAVIFFGFFPRAIDLLAYHLGVSYPPTLLIIFAVGFFLIKILTMDLERSAGERRLRRLTQRLAILEERYSAERRDNEFSANKTDQNDQDKK